MAHAVMGALSIAAGIVAAWVGLVATRQALRTARRAYRKTAGLCAAAPEGWSGWFLDGFSGVTMGLRWLYAMVAWLTWTLAGLGFIGVGLRLVSRT